MVPPVRGWPRVDFPPQCIRTERHAAYSRRVFHAFNSILQKNVSNRVLASSSTQPTSRFFHAILQRTRKDIPQNVCVRVAWVILYYRFLVKRHDLPFRPAFTLDLPPLLRAPPPLAPSS